MLDPKDKKTFKAELEVVSSGPLPDLCHKCGRCCTVAVTAASPKELAERVAAGEPSALEFVDVFEPYASIEEARKVVPEHIDRVLAENKSVKFLEDDELTFYHCRYVSPEGVCTIYERRPQCCRAAPQHGWSMMPPECGFEGWQFLERESQKHSVRALKRSLYVLEQMSPDGNSHPLRPEESLDSLRERIQQKIEPWKRYGSEFW